MQPTKIHIMPHDGGWEVEDDDGAPLTRTENKEDAIHDAQSFAKATHAEILLHHPDGVTEPLKEE